MNTGRKYCIICTSPYRSEIEELQRRKVSLSDIGRKYHKLYGKTYEQFYQTIGIHFRKKHPPVIVNDPTPIEEREAVDFTGYADKLLQEGYRNVNNNPSSVKPSHVIQAQRTLLEERKIKSQEDSMKFAFIKFMRGKAIEGEIVDVQPIREQALPANTD